MQQEEGEETQWGVVMSKQRVRKKGKVLGGPLWGVRKRAECIVPKFGPAIVLVAGDARSSLGDRKVTRYQLLQEEVIKELRGLVPSGGVPLHVVFRYGSVARIFLVSTMTYVRSRGFVVSGVAVGNRVIFSRVGYGGDVGVVAIPRVVPAVESEGVEGQDRESYSDEQDRESYVPNGS